MDNKIQEEDILAFASRFKLADELRGKRIAITGATGLLGSSMVKCLLALDKAYGLGLHVLAIVRNADKARAMFGDDIELTTHDFQDMQALTVPDGVDTIVHFASPTASKYFVSNPVETMMAGFQGTKQVLDAAAKAGSSVVYVSSLEVYGSVYNDSKPVDEDCQGYINPMEPRSSYPMAKRAAECLCKSYAAEYGLPVYVARLAQTFGAGVTKDDNRVFAQFARSAISHQDIVLHTTGKLSRCYCYTTDAIEGLLYIMLRGKDGEAYNVANEDTYISIADMAALVCDSFGCGIKTVVQLQDGMGYSPVTRLRLDTSKLRSLGWQPHYGLKEMFHRLITSFA